MQCLQHLGEGVLYANTRLLMQGLKLVCVAHQVVLQPWACEQALQHCVHVACVAEVLEPHAFLQVTAVWVRRLPLRKSGLRDGCRPRAGVLG